MKVVKRLLSMKLATEARKVHDTVKELKCWQDRRMQNTIWNFGTSEDPKWPDSVLSMQASSDPVVMAAAMSSSTVVANFREVAYRSSATLMETEAEARETLEAKQMLVEHWGIPGAQAARLANKQFWRSELKKWDRARQHTSWTKEMMKAGRRLAVRDMVEVARTHTNEKRRISMLLKEEDLFKTRGETRSCYFPFFVHGGWE